jgi:hypothetical protein
MARGAGEQNARRPRRRETDQAADAVLWYESSKGSQPPKSITTGSGFRHELVVLGAVEDVPPVDQI